MSQEKWTKGPWGLERVRTGWIVGRKPIMGVDYVADVHEHVDGNVERPAANAHLIAAAPELYSALWLTANKLRTVLHESITDKDVAAALGYQLRAMEKVMAKARGETPGEDDAA